MLPLYITMYLCCHWWIRNAELNRICNTSNLSIYPKKIRLNSLYLKCCTSTSIVLFGGCVRVQDFQHIPFACHATNSYHSCWHTHISIFLPSFCLSHHLACLSTVFYYFLSIFFKCCRFSTIYWPVIPKLHLRISFLDASAY